MTIISRVVSHLRVHGHSEEADKLLETIKGLGSSVQQLLALQRQQSETVRELVFTMQSRCKHFEWYLVSTNVESNPATWGPEDVIACYECGHTLCDKAAADFGRRVLRGDYFIHSRAGGRRFGLSPFIKKQLGDKLVVKEIGRGEDVYKEALRDPSQCAGEVEATGSHPVE